MKDSLQLISFNLLNPYQQQVGGDLTGMFDLLKDAEVSTDSFSFYTSVSAIASSRIEGEQMEMDSYVKHKMLHIDYLPDLVQKPNDLYNAYLFAQTKRIKLDQLFKAPSTTNGAFTPPKTAGGLAYR